MVLLLALLVQGESDREGWERLSSFGDGYVVWESNRTRRWRIWFRRLDGSGLRQLSADEEGRDHLCPHVSPDGTRVVYLSVRGKRKKKEDPRGELRLLYLEDGEERTLQSDVRASTGDRAVVWADRDRLFFLDGKDRLRELNVETSEVGEPLIENARGYLLNPTRTHAFERFYFHPYDPDTRKIRTSGKKLGGCEPYVTRDGVWGYRMNGAGGPIDRVDLATGRMSTLLDKHDARMPKGRAYLYFPMISSCQRMIAFAASPDKHDHNTSDYDIFVAKLDPSTLQVEGSPVRFTFEGHTDRYPDVFLSGLALGVRRGEAPFTVDFDIAADHWDYGDGGENEGPVHTYTETGRYSVVARTGEETLSGLVLVRPARPPHIVQAALHSKKEIKVTFDEPVRIDDADFSLDSGIEIVASKLTDDHRSVLLQIKASLEEADVLHIAGVTDRAQEPNEIEPAEVRVAPFVWPANRSGLVFLWEHGKAENLVPDPDTGDLRAYPVRARGRGRLDRNHAMRLARGAFASPEADDAILALKSSNEFTIEAIIHPDHLKQSGPARIITFSENTGSRNFTVGQENQKLVLRLRTPKTGANGTNPQIDLCALTANEPIHVIITFREGRTVCYRNGTEVANTTRIQGDFSNWDRHQLHFGNEATNDRDWAGTLHGIAIYLRSLDAAEATSNAAVALSRIRSREEVRRIEVDAKLVSRSDLPSLNEIEPYREALATFEYEVLKVRRGKKVPDRIRVVHWVLLDGRPESVANAKQGETFRLVLEPLDKQPQLEPYYLSDTLKEDFEARLWFDVRP